MTHDQKIAHFEQMLRDRRYQVHKAIPPLWRLLWKLGLKTPPPYFLPFLLNIAIYGLPFAGLWGILMWLLFWRNEAIPATAMAIGVFVAGLLYGLYMANASRRDSEKLRLPDWSRFPSQLD